MKKIWALFIFSLVSNASLADTAMPSSKTLLNNFDKLGIADKGQWKNGKSPDGVRLLSYRIDGDIYSINPEFASSVSISSGTRNKEEFLHSESICKNLVFGVVGEKNNDIDNKVSDIVYGAAKSAERTTGESIKDFWVEASFISIGKYPALACKVSKIATWD
ncbi:hypothetical protein ITQ64_001398 [Salmonella enterica subsp. enterica serovar Java]|nr:hypothetical protein [Salmonella enterica subsp. enterica serovar Java]